MPAIQTNYNERMGVAQVGMIADSRPHSIRSMNYETAANIDFGIALMFGDNDNGAKLAGTVFAGIVVAAKVVDPTGATADQFTQNTTVGLLTSGAIYVEPNVNVNDGDVVHYIAATGAISNTGGVLIPGARFETTAQAGNPARVFLA